MPSPKTLKIKRPSVARLEQFFAPCPRGLETVLSEELAELGAGDVRATEGGVGFAGTWRECYRANLQSRIASRILWRVGSAPYRSEEDVYRAAKAINWTAYFPVDCTIRVNIAAIRSPLTSLDFVTLRIKDAVCDRFRQDRGERPSVDTAKPDVRIHAFVEAEQATFYLDTSGAALFKRGYRNVQGEAPLRENLAAGILRLSGWHPDTALVDPMCGSGTLLIEAASMALNIAPGAKRSFGFERLATFDEPLWQTVRAEAEAARRAPHPLAIHGADLFGAQLKLARENLAAAGLLECVTLKQANALEYSPPPAPGVLVANPPYGVRLGEENELAELYPQLGTVLKQRYAGWRACIFTADMRVPKLIGLKPARKIPLFNGALECRLYIFEMVAGSMRRVPGGHDEETARSK